MTRLWGTYQLLLALLVALVALGGNTLVHKDTDKVLWELKNVSSSSGNVKQCLWFAMQEYNKDSEDKFSFQVVKVLRVQMQVGASSQFAYLLLLAPGSTDRSQNEREGA